MLELNSGMCAHDGHLPDMNVKPRHNINVMDQQCDRNMLSVPDLPKLLLTL